MEKMTGSPDTTNLTARRSEMVKDAYLGHVCLEKQFKLLL